MYVLNVNMDVVHIICAHVDLCAKLQCACDLTLVSINLPDVILYRCPECLYVPNINMDVTRIVYVCICAEHH